MYAFKVSLNGQTPVIGGATDLGVLTAILTGTGTLGPNSVPHRSGQGREFTFRLGGLTSRASDQADEHVTWLDLEQLGVGDSLTIEIVETQSADPICQGEAAEEHEFDERAYFEHCKKGYLSLRGKYEGENGCPA